MGDVWDFWQLLQDRFPRDFAADVFKALLGTLIGGTLAFWFGLRKDHLARQQEQRAAGNAAITTVARMVSDFMQVRFAIADHRKTILAAKPGLPLWMQVLPMPFKHAENLHFDIRGLTFIFDHKQGPDVFNKLMNVEIKYHSFFHLVAEHRKFAEEGQNLIAEHHPDPMQQLPTSQLAATLGFARVKRLESLIKGIFSYVDDPKNVYDEAAEELPKLLKGIFKKGVVKLEKPTEEQLRQHVVT
jgi:hypothetical protein